MRSAWAQPQSASPDSAQRKLDRILDSAHPLCKNDVIWILEFIKKKVTEEDPQLMELSQPRLMQNFRYFADIALMLIQRRDGFDQEADRLKAWVAEASFGLMPPKSDGKSQRN